MCSTLSYYSAISSVSITFGNFTYSFLIYLPVLHFFQVKLFPVRKLVFDFKKNGNAVNLKEDASDSCHKSSEVYVTFKKRFGFASIDT